MLITGDRLEILDSAAQTLREVGYEHLPIIKVLFVKEDHLSAADMRYQLAGHGVDCRVVCNLFAARTALRQYGWRFDAVVLDFEVHGGRGADLLPDIDALPEQPGIVILSDFVRELPPETASYRPVLATSDVAPPVLASMLRTAVQDCARSTVERFARHFHLTVKEAEVLRHMAKGMSPKKLATDLGCSSQAVYAVLSRIGRKTECSGYHEIVARLLRFSCPGFSGGRRYLR